MSIKVGINGLGRIGRGIFRANLNKEIFEVVAVNEINKDPGNIAYTLNYDTLYGQPKNKFHAVDRFLCQENTDNKIRVFNEPGIENVDWKSIDVDCVIDASGVLSNVLHARQLIDVQNIKKVFVTHSPNDVDFTLVLGANEHAYDADNHHLISSSICDATAIAPVLKLINEHFSIDGGYITTLHPWLNYQNLLDGQSSSWSVPGEIHHHYALGRSAIGNMIPKPTSAMDAVHKVLNDIRDGSIGSFSYRTPTSIVGSADITLNLKTSVTRDEIVEVFQAAARSQSLKIIKNNIEPLVSLDFLGSEYSVVIDHRWTDVVNDNMVKLVLWYDNEFGYSCRVVDQVKYVFEKMGN